MARKAFAPGDNNRTARGILAVHHEDATRKVMESECLREKGFSRGVARERGDENKLRGSMNPDEPRLQQIKLRHRRPEQYIQIDSNRLKKFKAYTVK